MRPSGVGAAAGSFPRRMTYVMSLALLGADETNFTEGSSWPM
jgi:hypothetical protein